MACLAVLAACAAVAGCGGATGQDRPDKSATLLLDASPGGVDAGIFSAVRRGYDEAEGVHLRVRAPTDGTDPTRLLLAGRVSFAVVDLHDLAIARERHRDVVAVLALVQRALPAVRHRRLRIDDSGAPPYPELVVAATRQTVDTDPALVGATVRALARGYRFTLTDPDSSAQDLIESNPGLDAARVTAQLDGLDSAFVG